MRDVAAEFQQRTAAHYDAYPFEFLTEGDEASIESVQPAPFVRFVDAHAKPGMATADVGCGPGRATLYLCQRGLDVTAVDLSASSILLARQRAPRAHFVRATNLTLPFADQSFDLVISDGVIHHTPDAARALAENARILKPDGKMYLGVYKRAGHYYYMYSYVGAVLRGLDKTRLGRAVVFGTAFPIYYAVHAIRSRGKRTLRGALNFFCDYFLTPVASFYRAEDVVAWARENGLTLLTYDGALRNVHVFVFQKTAEATPELVRGVRETHAAHD